MFSLILSLLTGLEKGGSRRQMWAARKAREDRFSLRSPQEQNYKTNFGNSFELRHLDFRACAGLRGRSEVESRGKDFKQAGTRRHVHHIVPARLIRRLRAGNPDRGENLQCICETCHGYKLQANHRLCLGDKLGYLEILRNHHFDVEVAERALALVGLQPSPKKNTD